MRLPRDRFIVITGLSGSGKSSLAFDTIYAEGQRRYVESLSAYARQFLGQMDKPDVDSIEGLSPAISIDQKTTSRNPRSTVGTVTEIYDYLRLLYARIGHPHCPQLRAPHLGAEHPADRRPGVRAAARDQVQRGRAGGAWPQRRVRQALRAVPRRRLHARAGGRRGARARGGHRARQEVQARRRRGRRPPGHEGGPEAAAHRLRRDRRPARRRPRRDRDRRRRDPHVQREVRLRALRHLAARDPAAHLQLQQPARRLPHLSRPRLHPGDRPGARRPRRVGQHRQGRAAAVRAALVRLARAGVRVHRHHLRRRHRQAVGRRCPRSSATSSCTAPARSASPSAIATTRAVCATTRRASRASSSTCSGASPRPSRSRCARRSRSTWPTGRARSARGRGSSPRASPSRSASATSTTSR